MTGGKTIAGYQKKKKKKGEAMQKERKVLRAKLQCVE